MNLMQELDAIIAEYDLLKHMFYQAWSRGELSMDILQRYASQYYHQVQSFPRFISRVHTACPEISARKVLLENLVDEEMHGTDHPALWMQFANGLGVSEAEVRADEALPETNDMVNTYYALAERNWQDGLCALYAYESQVPQVSHSKIAGLKEHYGINCEKTLEFFTAHEVYDVGHSAQVASLIEQYAEPEAAKKATREAAQALWKFLDGMCEVGGIHC